MSSTTALGYNNYYERSPRRNEYHTNKALNRIGPGPRYEEVGKEFPTVHENKQHKGGTKSTTVSMKTVGVLDYSNKTNNNYTGNMKSEKENVRPHGGSKVNKSHDQFQRQGNMPAVNKSYPQGSTSPRRAPGLSEPQYAGSNNDRKGQSQFNPTKAGTSPRRPPGLNDPPYGNKNTVGIGRQNQQSEPGKTSQVNPRRNDQQQRRQAGNHLPEPNSHLNETTKAQGNRGNLDEIKPNDDAPLVQPTKEGLSMHSKVEVLSKNRHLIYQETVWTKKRLEKLRATGFGDAAMFKKIRATKEERRWDHIMKFVREDPTSVQKVWMFLRTDYSNLHSVLNEQYLLIIRNYFKPRISNLQTTPANANKMIEILLEQAESYDQRIYELDQSLAEKEKSLSGAMKVLGEARKVVYNWAGREVPESGPDDDIASVSQELLDTVVVISAEKSQELEDHIQENAELKKKVGKLGKTLKEKDRQSKDSKSSILS